MDNQELLQAISALLEKELSAMRDEIKEMKSEIKELKAGQEQIRHDIADLSLAVGDIVNDVCDVMAAREEPIYQALEENRQAINLLARPLVMPAIQKTK